MNLHIKNKDEQVLKMVKKRVTISILCRY